MTRQQIVNLTKVCLLCLAFMFASDVLFYHSTISNWFSGLIENSNGWIVWLIVYLLMFAQVIIPIPAICVIAPAVKIGLNMYIFFGVTLAGYITGVVVMYWIGRCCKGAVKWVAGSQEEADKWNRQINDKGKWFYLVTIVLPIFPDDLLVCLVGATKMNFWFVLGANLIGRAIGLATALLCLNIINLGSGLATIIVEGVLLVGLLILWLILEIKKRRV